MDWVLAIRSDWLTPIFQGFSLLGEEYFFLLALPLGYWLWRRDAMGRVGAVLLFTVVLNAFIKELFHIPRPSIEHLMQAEGWSFPSGHAQMAMVLWGWLAWEIHRRWAYWTAGVLIVAIAASRVYLGVHYPQDVLGGILIGFLTLVAFFYLLNVRLKIWTTIGPTRQTFFLLFVLLGWYMFFPNQVPDEALKGGAALIGFWGGVLHERKYVASVASARLPMSIVKVIAGLLGVAFCVFGLKVIFTSIGYQTEMARFLRYLLAGAWIGWGLPWLAIQFGWEEIHHAKK